MSKPSPESPKKKPIHTNSETFKNQNSRLEVTELAQDPAEANHGDAVQQNHFHYERARKSSMKRENQVPVVSKFHAGTEMASDATGYGRSSDADSFEWPEMVSSDWDCDFRLQFGKFCEVC
jgi:hypothetical protein